MVSPAKVAQKFGKLDEFLRVLREIAETPVETFLKDKVLIGSAKYYLQVSIECCLDVANHVIASEHYRSPSDYADSFRSIGEAAVIDENLSQRLSNMAKFRNRLVHLYGEIDDRYIHEILQNDLTDIEEFKLQVIRGFGLDK